MDILITIVLTSLVWAVICGYKVRRITEKRVCKVLRLHKTFWDAAPYRNKSKAIKDYLTILPEGNEIFWAGKLPPECLDYCGGEHSTPELDNFIKTVKLLGRDLAILNKQGEIEIIV